MITLYLLNCNHYSEYSVNESVESVGSVNVKVYFLLLAFLVIEISATLVLGSDVNNKLSSKASYFVCPKGTCNMRWVDSV